MSPEWQLTLMVIVLVVAVLAIVLALANRRFLRKNLEEIKKYLAESIDGLKETSLKVREERQTSAEALIQRQQNELLQHLISLTRSGKREEQLETQNSFARKLMNSKVAEEIAEMIVQRVLEEIKKKW